MPKSKYGKSKGKMKKRATKSMKKISGKRKSALRTWHGKPRF